MRVGVATAMVFSLVCESGCGYCHEGYVGVANAIKGRCHDNYE